MCVCVVDDNKRISVEAHIRAVKGLPGLSRSPVFVCKEANYPCQQITNAAINCHAGQLRKHGEDVFGAYTTPQNKYSYYYQSTRAQMVTGQVRIHENWATANENRTREQTLETFFDHLGRQRIYRTGSTGLLTVSGKRNEAGVVVPGQHDDLYIAYAFALYWMFAFEHPTSRRQLYPNLRDYINPIRNTKMQAANMKRVAHAF